MKCLQNAELLVLE